MAIMRFEIRYANDIEPRYFWRLVTGQGRVLAWSENYTTKVDCIEAVAAIRAGAPTAEVLDRADDTDAPSGGSR